MYLTDKEIEQIKKFFADKPAKRVYLFGSYARGDADENSDIDLLIDWDYSKKIGWDFIDWWTDLKQLTNKDVDIVSSDFLCPRREKYILNDKTLLYEK